MIRAALFSLASAATIAFASPQAVSPKAVQSALENAWGNAVFSSVRLGETTQMAQELTFGSPTTVYAYNSKEIVDIEPVATGETRYSFWERTQERNSSGHWVTTSQEGTLTVMANKVRPNIPVRVGTEFPFGVQTVIQAWDLCVPAPGWQVECSNLSTATMVLAPPPAIANKPDCGGFANCEMKAAMVSFDALITYMENGHARTTTNSYELFIASEAPYLSRLVSSCITVPEQTTGRPSKICTKLTNFER